MPQPALRSLNKASRKLGLMKDQGGIMNRYIREQSHWDLHLNSCKNFITSNLPANTTNKIIAVLGSGWLLDVPIDILRKQFKEVWLIDLFHPRQIRHKAKSWPNVQLLVADISGGGITGAYRAIAKKERLRDQPVASDQLLQALPARPDYVVSVNILSQLASLLIDPLRARKRFLEDTLYEFGHAIQRQHMHLLSQFSALLISDYYEYVIDREGLVFREKNLLSLLLPQEQRQEWTWVFDTQGYYHKNFTTHFKVAAINMGM